MSTAYTHELDILVAPSDDEKRRVEQSYLRFVSAGVEFAVPIALFTLLGVWLDGRLETGPLFTIVLLLVGFASAAWNLIRTVLRSTDDAPGKPGSPRGGDQP